MGWVGWEDEGGCCLRRSSAFLLNWRRGGRGAQLRSRVAKLRGGGTGSEGDIGRGRGRNQEKTS